MEIKRDERTKFNLENFLKMAFHPKGMRGFAEGTICELSLDGSYASKLLRGSSFAFDIAKYAPLAVGIIYYLKN